MTPVTFPLLKQRASRRSFIATATSLTAATLFTGSVAGAVRKSVAWTGYPFTLGVASGDPSPDGFVLWTRLAPHPLDDGGMPDAPVAVDWTVAEDENFSRIVKKGTTTARPEWAHSVHVEVEGLKPDRWYWYRFAAAGETSPVGRTRTMPAATDMPGRFTFAFASCQHLESGYYTAYEHMLSENPDLVIHLGDYIYEGPGRDNQVRKHIGPEITTVADYRRRLAQYKVDPALQAMHAAAPWLVTWDDHEVDNNYAAHISEQASVGTDELLQRRAAAYQAYYEHMPLRRRSIPMGPDMRLFRRVSAGRLADFHLLDTRQYRTDQPCGDRNTAPCAEALDPNATLLGLEQKNWLFNGLAKSSATWNVLAQQVMMGPVDRTVGPETRRSMDQWPGYEIERRDLLNYFRNRRISNPVVLTGDIHANWANELTLLTDLEHKNPVAAEFVGTSITSGGNGRAEPANLDRLLSENPFLKFHNQERGYVRCEVTPGHWRTDYRTVAYVNRRGAPLQTRASFVLEPGSSKLRNA